MSCHVICKVSMSCPTRSGSRSVRQGHVLQDQGQYAKVMFYKVKVSMSCLTRSVCQGHVLQGQGQYAKVMLYKVKVSMPRSCYRRSRSLCQGHVLQSQGQYVKVMSYKVKVSMSRSCPTRLRSVCQGHVLYIVSRSWSYSLPVQYAKVMS